MFLEFSFQFGIWMRSSKTQASGESRQEEYRCLKKSGVQRVLQKRVPELLVEWIACNRKFGHKPAECAAHMRNPATPCKSLGKPHEAPLQFAGAA